MYLICYVVYGEKTAGQGLFLPGQRVKIGPSVVTTSHTATVWINGAKISRELFTLEIQLTPRHKRDTKPLKGKKH